MRKRQSQANLPTKNQLTDTSGCHTRRNTGEKQRIRQHSRTERTRHVTACAFLEENACGCISQFVVAQYSMSPNDGADRLFDL